MTILQFKALTEYDEETRDEWLDAFWKSFAITEVGGRK